LKTVYLDHMTATTLSTTFGPVKTGSTAAFIAVVKTETACRIGTHSFEAGVVKVHARAETRQALETRLRREGLSRTGQGSLWVQWSRSTIVDGVPTPGTLIATVEIVEVAK
jgi:hypothetical protein